MKRVKRKEKSTPTDFIFGRRSGVSLFLAKMFKGVRVEKGCAILPEVSSPGTKMFEA